MDSKTVRTRTNGVCDMQKDLISKQAPIDALKAIKHGLWEIDIPSPDVPEYIEYHKQIQNMVEIVDGWIKRIKELPPEEPDISEYPVDVKVAYERGYQCGYYEGKIDGINYCTEQLKEATAKLSAKSGGGRK